MKEIGKNEKNWAHQDLSKKKIKKYAATLTDDEVRDVVESHLKRGLIPVIVGSEVESGLRVAILDNQVVREFQIMLEWSDDSVWHYAITRYVFERGFQRFSSMDDLEAHVKQLTAEKYGQKRK